MAKEKIDYTEGIPTRPPDGVYEYLEKKKALNFNALIYSVDYVKLPLSGKKRKMVKVKCTACGEETHLTYQKIDSCRGFGPSDRFGFIDPMTNHIVKSYDSVVCPCCGAGCKAYHISRARAGTDIGHTRVLTVHVINGRLTLLYWLYEVTLGPGQEKHVRTQIHSGYIVDGKKLVHIVGYYRYFSTYVPLAQWENRTRLEDKMGVPCNIFPFDPKILEESNVPNCKLDLYVKSSNPRPVQYLRLYVKHKNIENLVTQGLSRFITACFSEIGYGSYDCSVDKSCFYFKKAKPHEMLGLTKEEYNVMKADEWAPEQLKLYIERLRGRVKLSEVRTVLACGGVYSIRRLFEAEGLPIARIARYIIKLRASDDRRIRSVDPGYYADYIHMASLNGEDITSDSVLFPQSLVNAHDYQSERYEMNKSKILDKQFKQRYKLLKEYEYTDEELGLMIVPAKSEASLSREGRALHHCVGSYAKRHAEGETDIFFIRKICEPKKSYFTLELNESDRKKKKCSIVQNRGLRNCAPGQDVIDFVAIWQKHVIQILTKG